ncbi:FG-GAP-like repeat-containing protein [Nannocystaceae bacterium ST9]
MRPLVTLACSSILGLVLGACFTGEGTLGAVCETDAQCGTDQTCRNQVCGMCRDDQVQSGEICYGASSEEIAFGEVSDLLAIDADFDGDLDLLAVVNDDCGGIGGACWDLRLLVPVDGDFESIELFDENVPGRVPEIEIGNFDGDDKPDIVAVAVPLDMGLDASQLAVLFDFPESATSVDVDVAVFARSLEAADLDGNGLDDLLIGAEIANTLIFVPSTGTGFGAERVLISDPAPRLAPPVDMDGDGDLDLIIGSGAGTIGVDLNDGNANFAPQPRQMLGEGFVVDVVATADFDADGNLDVVTLANSFMDEAPIISVYRGLGDGRLEPLATLPGGEYPVDILTDDVNFDGLPDIMVADLLEDKLPVFINRDGSFPDQVGIDVAAAPLTMLRGDFDNDGFVDLVIGNANGVISVVRSEN